MTKPDFVDFVVKSGSSKLYGKRNSIDIPLKMPHREQVHMDECDACKNGWFLFLFNRGNVSLEEISEKWILMSERERESYLRRNRVALNRKLQHWTCGNLGNSYNFFMSTQKKSDASDRAVWNALTTDERESCKHAATEHRKVRDDQVEKLPKCMRLIVKRVAKQRRRATKANATKRTPNSYALFVRDQYEAARAVDPTITYTHMITVCGERWKKLCSSDRDRYDTRAKNLKRGRDDQLRLIESVTNTKRFRVDDFSDDDAC